MEKRRKDVLIIIPAYNEGKTIGKLLQQLEQPEIADIAEVLVMNDASSDNTEEVVRAHDHAVVTHIFNLGYGNGLQTQLLRMGNHARMLLLVPALRIACRKSA